MINDAADMKSESATYSSKGQGNLSKEVLDFRTIYVTMTFSGFEPLTFEFARQNSEEIRIARQQFLGLNEEQQKEQAVTHRVGVLSDLLKKRPVNVPNYPEHSTGNIKTEFIEYFSDPDNQDMLTWLWNLYQDKLYPKELLSSVSG